MTQEPFPFTGKIDKFTIMVNRPTLTQEDIKKLEDREAIAVDGKPIIRCKAVHSSSALARTPHRHRGDR